MAAGAALAVPALPPLPRTRQTLLDPARRLTSRTFLAATAALVQPYAGRALDAGRITTRTGLATGLAVTAASTPPERLGRVRKVPPAPRRLAPHLAALSGRPSTSSTRATLRLAMH
ncbi:hypothetical protein ACFCXH_32600, partial [Streptomyces nojiriensis]